MAISSLTNRNAYTGNGNVNEYDYDFKIFDEDDLLVTLLDTDEEEITLDIGDDYTVDGVGSVDGGSITLVDDGQDWLDSDGNLLTGYIITIRRRRPLTQTTSIRNDGARPEVIEDALDNQIMISQQQQDEIDRCMKMPESTNPAEFDATLPTPVADQVLAINPSGDGLAYRSDLEGVSTTAFSQSLLADSDSEEARATLDAAQAIDSMTEETDPEASDTIPMQDISAPGERKITLENMLKVVGDITEDTEPSNLDSVLSYDASGTAAKRILIPRLMGAMQSPHFSNLAIVKATTTNANDSVRFQGAASAWGSGNPGASVMPLQGSDLLSVLYSTSDVTILLTGAHWGLDTKGDGFLKLYAYEINDAGTRKFGLCPVFGLTSISTSNSSATPADINAQYEMLVNSTLTGTSTCRVVGFVISSFDDTGGAASDLHAVQSVYTGQLIPQITNFGDAAWTPTISWTSNATPTGQWRLVGDLLSAWVKVATTGAPTSASLTITLPSGYKVHPDITTTSDQSVFGVCTCVDASTANYAGLVVGSGSATTVKLVHGVASTSNLTFADVTQAAPFTFGSGDFVYANFSVPILRTA